MMIRIFFYLAIIFIGLCISPFFVGNTGYIYISFGDYQLETSLVFAGILLIIAYVSIKIAEIIIIKLLNLLISSRYLPQHWRKRNAKKNTLIGALAMAEEDWLTAEKAMAKGAKNGEIPALNLLAAANAAQHQHNMTARDTYLSQAAELENTKRAVNALRTRYYIEQKDLVLARASLEQLTPNSQSKGSIIALAVELYLLQQDWTALKSLLPTIKKKNIFPKDKFTQLYKDIYQGLLADAVGQSEESLEKCWQWLSREDKNHPFNIALYAKGLNQFNHREKAIKLLLKNLKHNKDKYLFDALAQIITAMDDQALKQLHHFSSSEDNNPDYQYCMAIINERLRDFKQAKIHWQRLCHALPNKNNWLALGKIQEQLGDSLGAIHSYRKALSVDIA